MQIEQFDTGLKGQGNVEKIVITPEENYNYKQVVRKYLGTIVKEVFLILIKIFKMRSLTMLILIVSIH